jgi:hypothetical protein
MDAGGSIAARFIWHPVYGGRTVFDVRQELVHEIEGDQRAWALALDAAEEHEADALATVKRLDEKWSQFDLNWAEMDPGALADRILAWEWEREKRHELFPYSEMREQMAQPTPAPTPPPASRTLPWLPSWLRRLFGLDDA